jgi:hypothetical protein
VVRVPKRLAVVVAVSAAAAVGLPGPAATVPALAPVVAVAAKKPGPIDRAVQRLQAAQNKDGGFGKQPGEASDPVTSVWAALALAAVGVHPADQPARGTTALDYLAGKDGGAGGVLRRLTDSSDLAAYAILMQSIDEGFRAVSAVSSLEERIAGSGGIPERMGGVAEVRPTALATLAFAKDEARRQELAERSTRWLKEAFFKEGWGARARAAARPDMTGLALQALFAGGQEDEEKRELSDKATKFLYDELNPDGGLGTTRTAASDPRSTAYVMQGLKLSGTDPGTWGTNLDGKTPKTYLTGQQDTDGGFGDTLTTAQILPGFNATGYSPKTPVTTGSPLASKRSGEVERERERKNAAKEQGTGGGADVLDEADTQNDGDGRDPSTSDDGSPETATPSSPAGNPEPPPAPAAPPAATPSPAPAPATPAPEKPADDTVAAAGTGDDEDDPTPDGAATKQVDGVVVGARAAAASTAPGVAAGAGDAGDRGTAVLGGLIVALILVGTQLERRRPKRIVS